MPHINVKCYPGKTKEQKEALAEAILRDVCEIFGNSEASVSVAIEDVQKENWKSDVYDAEIMGRQEILFKAPGYEM